MNYPAYFVAFDLGATSGRTILAELHADGKLTTEEINRFPNAIINVNGSSHWNIYSLFEHIKDGLRKVAQRGIKPVSVAVDTWGVDIACVAADGSLLGLPVAYRDQRFCDSNTARFFAEAMDAEKLYSVTGIQVINFNTVFQLNALKDTSAMRHADRIGFVPDVISYLLTGVLVTEYTIASTGAIVDARSRRLAPEIIEAAGADPSKFGPLVAPGTPVGMLRPEICAATGIDAVPVIAVGGHDTASAVAAIPAKGSGWAYLSSGTWSLMGIESAEPVINEKSAAYNITNEGGIEGTIRVLKNITGMWILEECLKCWKRQGVEYTYPELVAMAAAAGPFKCFIDPDDPRFVAPADMPAAIADFCAATGQQAPEGHAEIVRCIFESLALKYRAVLDLFREVSGQPIELLHVIGGGSRNALLNQFTASAINLPVIAGPVECTALGNILMQARAAGYVDSLDSLREIVARNVETTRFDPVDPELWDEPARRFNALKPA
ncbi:MAG: rhamnulokinase [[Clostridium] fimetarium]|nr:rhamnulokinase [Alistipes timonensis]MCM1405009.1 rhamnulokinase [[Clostridium] fimetarium]